MNEIEISDLIKELLSSCSLAYSKLEESETFVEMEAEMEDPNTSDSRHEELEKKAVLLRQEIKESIFKVLSLEEKKAILNAMSREYIAKYQLPKTFYGNGLFEELIQYIILSIEDENIINSLITSTEFISTFRYSRFVIDALISKCQKREAVQKFFNYYKEESFLPDDLNKTVAKSDINLSDILLSIFNNPNLDYSFKEKLLLSDNNYAHISNYFITEVMESSVISKENKLRLLKNRLITSNLNGIVLATAIGSLCESYEEAKNFLADPEISSKIDVGALIGEIKLPSKDYKKLLNDDLVFNRLNNLSLGIALSKAEMDFEDLKEIIFAEKFLALLDKYSLAQILCSEKLTLEQRASLIDDERFFSKLVKGGSVLGVYFRTSRMPLKDKLALCQIEKLYPYITEEMIQNIFSNKDADLETCTKLLFDKNLFYKLIREYHPTYNPTSNNKGPFKYDKYEILKKLHENNKQIAKTLSIGLLRDEIIDLGFNFIQIMAKYPIIANNLNSHYSRDNLLLIKKMIEALKKLNIDYSNQSVIIEKIIKMAGDNSCYSDVISSTKISEILHNQDFDINNLSTFQWQVLMDIGLRDYSSYNNGFAFGKNKVPIDISLNIMPSVKTSDDLNDFEERRIALCDDIFYKAINNGNLDEAKNAYFNKYLGINLEEAREINRLYGHSLDEFKNYPEYSKAVAYLEHIRRVIAVNNLDVISNLFNSQNYIMPFAERITIDEDIRKIFSQNISNNVFKTEYGSLKYIEITDNGNPKLVQVYDAGVDFKMLIHSTAAYGQMEILNDNYYDSWNKSSRIANHGICCSLISNDNLGIASVNDVLFGFDSWDPTAIVKSAPYDIHSYNDGYNITECRSIAFMSAQDIIDNTRDSHNEQVLERYELREERRTPYRQNIQPSYVIIYSDMSDNLKQKAVKCSKEMHIPIVYIDKQKIITNEVRKIDSLISRFKENNLVEDKIAILKQILTSHENNRNGLRITNPSSVDTYFPTDKITQLFKTVIEQIQSTYLAANDFESYQKYSNALLDVLDAENDKFKYSGNSIDIPIEELKASIMQPINANLNKNNVPRLMAIVEDVRNTLGETNLAVALNKVDLPLTYSGISTVVDQGYYSEDDKENNIGHIERVAVLVNLIAQNEFSENGELDLEAIDILTAAAVYHDSGKESEYDNSLLHGKKSSDIMLESIDPKAFTEEERKYISLIIEYHDDPNLTDNFETLCKQKKIDPKKIDYVRKLAFTLQDANYLDRKSRSEVLAIGNPRVHYKSSKKLVDIAQELKHYYEIIDRKLFNKLCHELSIAQRKSAPSIEEGDTRK